MKKLQLLFIFLFLGFVFGQYAKAQNTEWQVISYSIKFKIKNVGFNVDGTFAGLAAKIIFDKSKDYGNSIEAAVDAKTINTANKSRDGHLKTADYFDVEKYPKILLKTNVIAKDKDSSYNGYFQLSMKDKVKDVTIPFTFVTTLKGSFKINRLDYGVGESSMILSNSVTVFLEVDLIKK